MIIELESQVYGGPLPDRFNVMLRARAVSVGTIRSATLFADGAVCSAIGFGDEPSELTLTLPNGVAVQQRTLQFSFARSLDRAAATVPCRIETESVDGTRAEQAFELALDPAGAPAVRIVAGPLQPADVTADRSPAVLYVERAVIDDAGQLLVEGWAVSLQQILVIQGHLGDRRFIARTNLGRDDVAQAYPAYPGAAGSGFQIITDLPAELRDRESIRVEMMCRHGLSHDAVVPIQRVPSAQVSPLESVPQVSIAPPVDQGPSHDPTAEAQVPVEIMEVAPVEVPSARDREIFMYCDEVRAEWDGRVIVSGWATSAAGVVRVAVAVNDVGVGVAEIGHDRPDVGAEHGTIPSARFSGFRFDRVVADGFTGQAVVQVTVTNTLGDERIDSQTLTVSDRPAETVPIPLPQPMAAPQPAAPADPAPSAQPIAASEPDPAQMKFQLDSPHVVQGLASDLVTGRLTIDGWVLARSPVTAIEVDMDGQRLGDAHHGLARQDVGAAFADWPNAVRSGFAFHCPPRSLRDGMHEIRLTARCENGFSFARMFQINVRRADTTSSALGLQRRLPRTGRGYLHSLMDRLGHHPSFVIFLHVADKADPDALSATLRSVDAQAHGDWRMVVLCERPDAADTVRNVLDSVSPAIRWRSAVLAADMVGWTEPLARDDSAFHLILRPGDELGVDALAELAIGSGQCRDADMLYADEHRFNPISREREAFLKPDFSPDLLWSTNYIGRPWVVGGRLLAATGATPASIAENGEYDLILHCAEQADVVHHVPKLLCERGADDPNDDARSVAALVRAAARQGIDAEVLPTAVPHAWRLRRAVPVKGKVSIIIPTCGAHGHIETCITTLRGQTTYPDYEIIVIDNIPDADIAWKIYVAENADLVVDIPDAFNWSRFNNQAAAVANGEYLLFLNDDVEIIQPDWLDALVENAARPEVGIVGARLLYPSRTVQHAGMFLARNGIARHAFRFAAEDDPCYFGLAMTQRNVMAVTGACLLVRRSVFDQLGRFDEAHQVVNNDLDFCLRGHRAGLLTVYTPHATLIHHELASRDRLKDDYDTSHFNSTWAARFHLGDPYFNPRLYRHSDEMRPDDEPVEIVHSGQPLFTADEIRRLLVVKLDHIGDFITVLPSVRRLKELFPLAHITVLSAPAAQSFAAFEPAIDEFIAFEFFHVKSGMGRKEVTEAELVELGKRLRPKHFDLAIDLRKQPDTRDVLKYSGARYLAGYDHQAQFNFLDVALEWETDRSLHHKRNHVSDDLLNLVEAVGQASRFHRPSLHVPAEAAKLAVERLPEDVRRLFDKPVAIVHPGVGSAVKQWPLPYFAALIDLLVARHDLNIVVIGSPDEAELAGELLDKVTAKSAVASLVGLTPLRDLPALLANATLYVGGDSGPKHIAAAVGVPTIGIHSGVVDTTEWGPVGHMAIALRRTVACSPCYLARADDCPRALACLTGLEPTLVYEAAAAMLGHRLARPIGPRFAVAGAGSVVVSDRAAGASDNALDPMPAGTPIGEAAKKVAPERGRTRTRKAKGTPLKEPAIMADTTPAQRRRRLPAKVTS